MQNIRIPHLLMWVAVALYIFGAIAWAGTAPTTTPQAELSGLAAIIHNPGTWAFIGWESIFILAGLTVRAIVLRVTE